MAESSRGGGRGRREQEGGSAVTGKLFQHGSALHRTGTACHRTCGGVRWVLSRELRGRWPVRHAEKNSTFVTHSDAWPTHCDACASACVDREMRVARGERRAPACDQRGMFTSGAPRPPCQSARAPEQARGRALLIPDPANLDPSAFGVPRMSASRARMSRAECDRRAPTVREGTRTPRRQSHSNRRDLAQHPGRAVMRARRKRTSLVVGSLCAYARSPALADARR